VSTHGCAGPRTAARTAPYHAETAPARIGLWRPEPVEGESPSSG